MAIRDLKNVKPNSSEVYTEASFRRFENDIRQICRAYPSPTTLRPTTMKISTYTSRLRCAMAAYINSVWASDIPRDTVLEVRKNFEFQQDLTLNYVFIGPRKSALMQGALADQAELQISAMVDAYEEDILNAICVLKNRNLIGGSVSIFHLSAEKAYELMELFPNIAISRNEDSTAILI